MKVFVIFYILLIAACSTSGVRIYDGPTGRIYESSCAKDKEKFVDCFNLAANTCNHGYRVIDSAEHEAYKDPVDGSTTPKRRNLYFRCY